MQLRFGDAFKVAYKTQGKQTPADQDKAKEAAKQQQLDQLAARGIRGEYRTFGIGGTPQEYLITSGPTEDTLEKLATLQKDSGLQELREAYQERRQGLEKALVQAAERVKRSAEPYYGDVGAFHDNLDDALAEQNHLKGSNDQLGQTLADLDALTGTMAVWQGIITGDEPTVDIKYGYKTTKKRVTVTGQELSTRSNLGELLGP